MVKVFLVEDEVIIRNGIKNSIPWEQSGLEFVGEASDGELAYPLIKKTKPDILITDIKMPFMDGLELSRLVKKELPDIKILILSGYNEFDYAKTAISLGITDYLLKPISAEKLLEAIQGVVEVIHKERTQKQVLSQYEQEIKENEEQKKLHLFNQLMRGHMSVTEALEEGEKLGADLGAEVYQVLLLKILYNGNSNEYSEQLIEASEAVESMMQEKEHVFWCRRGMEGWGLLLMEENEDALICAVDSYKNSLDKIQETFDRLEYFGGLGTPVYRLRDMGTSFRHADRVFAMRFVSEPNQILTEDTQERIRNKDSLDVTAIGSMEENRKLIEKFLVNGSEEEVDSFITAYFAEIPEDNFKSMIMRQYIAMDIYISVIAFAEKLNIPREEIEKQTENEKRMLEQADSIETIREFMKCLLTKTIVQRDTIAGRRYSDIIIEAKNYIDEKYMTEEISLNSVASRVNMSPSYFSSIFSREVEKTFVEYLTEVRMEKAKELLRCTSMKTSEVGYEIGYKDSHYFSYIFKKTQKITPKEYRARGKQS